MQASMFDFDHVYTPFGTGGIFTSLLYSFHYNKQRAKFTGISVNRKRHQCHENIQTWWTGINELLEVSEKLPDNFEVSEDFIGKGYGDPTDACIRAIRVMAETEGIMMDFLLARMSMSVVFGHFSNSTWNQTRNMETSR